VYGKKYDFSHSSGGINWRLLQFRQLPLTHSATAQKPTSMRLMTTSDEIAAKSINETPPKRALRLPHGERPPKLPVDSIKLCIAASPIFKPRR
jgi:hypothetical protein